MGQAWRFMVKSVVGGLSVIGLALASAPLSFGKAEASNAAPFSAPNPLPNILLMMLGLGIVLFLAYFLIRFLGTKTQVRNQGAIHVVAVRQVGPNRSIQVIDVSGHRFLIGVGEQITLLANLTDDLMDEVESTEDEPTVSFGAMLAETLKRARSRYGPVQREEQD